MKGIREKCQKAMLIIYKIIGKEYKENVSLPSWEEFPDIGLYMDQVLFLMEKYIGCFVSSQNKEKFLTPSMINNYVKLGVMPPPVNKKYTRKHLAYLIIICLMKQALSISSIANIIKMQLNSKTLEELYAIFCIQYESILTNFLKTGTLAIRPISDDYKEDELYDSILEIGIISNITRTITENVLTCLDTKEQEKSLKIKDKETKNVKKTSKEKNKQN